MCVESTDVITYFAITKYQKSGKIYFTFKSATRWYYELFFYGKYEKKIIKEKTNEIC